MISMQKSTTKCQKIPDLRYGMQPNLTRTPSLINAIYGILQVI